MPWGLAQCRSTQRWGLRLTKKSLQGSQTHPLPAATSAVCRGTLWACSGQVQGGTSPPLWSPRGQGVPDRAVVPCTAVTPVLTALGSALPRAHRHHPNAGSRAPPFESFLIAEVEGGGGRKEKKQSKNSSQNFLCTSRCLGRTAGRGQLQGQAVPMGQTREGAGGPCQGAELPKHGGFAQGPGSFPCGSVGSALGQWVLGAGAHGVGILVRFGVMCARCIARLSPRAPFAAVGAVTAGVCAAVAAPRANSIKEAEVARPIFLSHVAFVCESPSAERAQPRAAWQQVGAALLCGDAAGRRCARGALVHPTPLHGPAALCPIPPPSVMLWKIPGHRVLAPSLRMDPCIARGATPQWPLPWCYGFLRCWRALGVPVMPHMSPSCPGEPCPHTAGGMRHPRLSAGQSSVALAGLSQKRSELFS